MRITKALRHLAVLFAAVAVISCGIESTAPTTPPIQEHLVGELTGTVGRVVGGLLTCRPLPAEREEALIGPAGGTLVMGPHSLVIPRGALREMTRIRGEIRRDTVNSVRLRPEGLQFAKPATLTLSYENCGLVGGLLTPKRIAYVGENLYIYYFLPSVDHPLQRKVTAPLDHFSRYAAAY